MSPFTFYLSLASTLSFLVLWWPNMTWVTCLISSNFIKAILNFYATILVYFETLILFLPILIAKLVCLGLWNQDISYWWSGGRSNSKYRDPWKLTKFSKYCLCEQTDQVSKLTNWVDNPRPICLTVYKMLRAFKVLRGQFLDPQQCHRPDTKTWNLRA